MLNLEVFKKISIALTKANDNFVIDSEVTQAFGAYMFSEWAKLAKNVIKESEKHDLCVLDTSSINGLGICERKR